MRPNVLSSPSSCAILGEASIRAASFRELFDAFIVLLDGNGFLAKVDDLCRSWRQESTFLRNCGTGFSGADTDSLAALSSPILSSSLDRGSSRRFSFVSTRGGRFLC